MAGGQTSKPVNNLRADMDAAWEDVPAEQTVAPQSLWEDVPVNAPGSTWADKLTLGGSPLGTVPRATVDFLEGSKAGLAKLIYGGADLLRRIPGATSVLGERRLDRPEVQAAMKAPESFAGQTGEFAAESAPFFAVGGAAKTGAQVAGKLIPALERTAARKLATRAALEGAGMGTLSAAEGSGPTGTVINTALGAVSPVVQPAVEAFASKAPPAIINNMLRPFVKQYRFGKNPGQGIVDEGIVAGSMNRLWEAVKAAKQKVGQSIGDVLQHPKPLKSETGAYLMPPPDPGNVPQAVVTGQGSFTGPLVRSEAPGRLSEQLDAARRAQQIETINYGRTINPEELTGPVDAAISEAMKAGDLAAPGLMDKLKGLRQFITHDPVTGNPRGPLTPNQAKELKTIIGENTYWSGEAYEKPLNTAKAQTYGRTAGRIENLVPEVGPLNERYANLLEAEKIAERRTNANPNLRLSEIGLGALGEGLMPHAGFAAFLTALGGRTALGATGLAQGIRRGAVPTARTLKDLVAAFVASNIARNSQATR